MADITTLCTAFDGDRWLASGPLGEVARAVSEATNPSDVQVFADADARPIDLDLRGSADDVVARLAAPAGESPKRPGRPKLGVVAREVTLLPRHWDWLSGQPGGASVALRKLVEAAQKDPREQARAAKEAAYRFITAMAGDRPGYEDAVRALFAGDRSAFVAQMSDWPQGVRGHALKLAGMS